MTSDRIGNITLINGDCLEYMRTLPEKAFSLAIVDPPYGDGIQSTDNQGIGGGTTDSAIKVVPSIAIGPMRVKKKTQFLEQAVHVHLNTVRLS